MVSDPWRVIANDLRVSYRTGSMVRGMDFLTRVVDAAERAGHHPDVDLRYATVHLTLVTHSAHRLTEADVALANTIAEIAREMQLESLAPPERFDLAIAALDIAAVRPFWQAVLGYNRLDGEARELESTDLVDPTGLLPPVWFQQMDEPRPQRSRMHVDLWVPADEVHQRVQAALEADGQLLTDAHAPSFWVLADPEGNEVCLCTWQNPADG
nr:pterin-4-alpha-carbinolamine dehydratase [Gordonia sp. NB41Y]